MTTMYDVPANVLIKRAAEELKKSGSVVPPQWAAFVKTGVSKERPPIDQDWWYFRAASMLRKTYMTGPIGVSKLRRKYGGNKNRGYKPGKFFKGSGNILRKVFQQLEAAKLVMKSKTGKAGRVITPEGKSMLDKIAAKIAREGSVKAPAKAKASKKTESKNEEADTNSD